MEASLGFVQLESLLLAVGQVTHVAVAREVVVDAVGAAPADGGDARRQEHQRQPHEASHDEI